ncbi:MAG: phosphocholine cytidylyltransferase family protein [Deltaproteobacteria bacterium]
MKAIILSAGQGKRLLPLTADIPKCSILLGRKTILEWQIDVIRRCGIEDVVVVLGYQAGKVEQLLEKRYGKGSVRTVFNPFYAVSDNLGTCWIVRGEMNEDFLLLNGDTLFTPTILRKVLESPPHPITVTVNVKDAYDEDDMKVSLEGDRLVRIGKDIPAEQVQAESIGMILFRGEGPSIFVRAVEDAMRMPEGTRRWYLSVIDALARRMPVWSCSITGLPWVEIDVPEDLKQAELVIREIDLSM